MVSRVAAEEVGPHSLQFLDAIAGERLEMFVGDASLVLIAQLVPETRMARQFVRPECQLTLEILDALAESIVEESDRLGVAGADGLQTLGEQQGEVIAEP